MVCHLPSIPLQAFSVSPDSHFIFEIAIKSLFHHGFCQLRYPPSGSSPETPISPLFFVLLLLTQLVLQCWLINHTSSLSSLWDHAFISCISNLTTVLTSFSPHSLLSTIVSSISAFFFFPFAYVLGKKQTWKALMFQAH